jgi:PAS domain S-box-containing protein
MFRGKSILFLACAPDWDLPDLFISSGYETVVEPIYDQAVKWLPHLRFDVLFLCDENLLKQLVLLNAIKNCEPLVIILSDRVAVPQTTEISRVHRIDISQNSIAIFEQVEKLMAHEYPENTPEKIEIARRLEERERYIREIIELLPGALYQSTLLPDGKRKVLYASERIKELFDMSPQDLSEDYEKYFDRIHPEDQVMMRQVADKVFKNILPFEFEYRLYSKNRDSYKWLYTKAIPYSVDGKTTLWNGTIRDVTQMHASDELIRAQKRMLDSARIGVFITVPDKESESAVIEFVNEEFCRMSGYKSEELIGLSSSKLILPESPAEKISLVREHVADRKVFNGELTWYKKDGTPFWVQMVVTPLTSPEGELTHIVAFITDITEKKNIGLQRDHDLTVFNSVIKNMQNGLMIVDQDLRILAVNPVYCAIFGLDYSEVSKPGFLFSPELTKSKFAEPERFVERLKIMKALKKPFLREEIKFKDGRIFERDYVPVFGANHKFIAHLIQYHDITVLKRAEYMLRAQNDDLVKINSELDRIIFSISHELMSPLISILGHVDHIEKETNNEEHLKMLETIKLSINRINFFISNIIIYNKNIKTELLPQEINLFDLIDETINSVNDFMKNQIEVRVTGDDRMPYIGDKIRLSVILRNLISNAIIFTDSAKENPFVLIKANCSAESVEIDVTDNGIGIEEPELIKIFDMFYRGSELSTGAGLGLYLVKEMTLKMRGRINIDSLPGKGTTVKVILPNLIVNRN